MGDELRPETPAIAEVAALYAQHDPAHPATNATEACRACATQLVTLSRCLDTMVRTTEAGPGPAADDADVAIRALAAVSTHARVDDALLGRLLEHARAVQGDDYAGDWDVARTPILARLTDSLTAATTAAPDLGDSP